MNKVVTEIDDIVAEYADSKVSESPVSEISFEAKFKKIIDIGRGPLNKSIKGMVSGNIDRWFTNGDNILDVFESPSATVNESVFKKVSEFAGGKTDKTVGVRVIDTYTSALRA